jgi:hypothetical protein
MERIKMEQKNDKKLNKIPPVVDFNRTKRQFQNTVALGYIGETPDDAAYFYRKLSSFLDLPTSKKIGELWRNSYTDPTAIAELDSYLSTIEYYKS